MIQNCQPIVSALIDAFLLLETCGADEVDPDTAVRGMENMSSSLLALKVSDQIALRMVLRQLAEEAQDQAYRDFVQALPDLIGLATE